MVFPKSVGYIVPPDPSPVDWKYTLFCVPDDGQWIATIAGALYPLADYYNWQQTTIDGLDADRNAAAETAKKIILGWIFNSGECGMNTICDVVAECIETDDDVANAMAFTILNNATVQSAITQYLSENGLSSGRGNPLQPLPPAIMANNIVPITATCTDENVYAMSRAIVQELDRLSTDFFDVIELLVNKWDVAGEIVAAIPVFGGLLSLAADTGQWIIDNVQDTYAAAYNSTTEVDFSCVIYCLMQSECAITWDDVIEKYVEKAGVSPPSSGDFISFMQWFITTVANTDNLVVGLMHLFILNALKYGSDFMGSGVWTALNIALEDAADEEITVPSECICENEWCYSIPLADMTLFDVSGAAGLQYLGVYNDPVWDDTVITGVSSQKTTGIAVQYDFASNVQLTRIECDVNGIAGTGNVDTIYSARIIGRNGTATEYDTYSPPYPDFADMPKTVSFDVASDNVDNIRFISRPNITTGTPNGSAELSAIRVYGTGIAPEWSGNC